MLVAINRRPLMGLTLYDAGEMLQDPAGWKVAPAPDSTVVEMCDATQCRQVAAGPTDFAVGSAT